MYRGKWVGAAESEVSELISFRKFPKVTETSFPANVKPPRATNAWVLGSRFTSFTCFLLRKFYKFHKFYKFYMFFAQWIYNSFGKTWKTPRAFSSGRCRERDLWTLRKPRQLAEVRSVTYAYCKNPLGKSFPMVPRSSRCSYRGFWLSYVSWRSEVISGAVWLL